MPMKKQWEHLVVKLFTIFWISPASTSCVGFGIRSFRETGSLVIIDDFLALFDRVVYRLVEDVGVLLSARVSEGVVLLEFDGTGHGFLTA